MGRISSKETRRTFSKGLVAVVIQSSDLGSFFGDLLWQSDRCRLRCKHGRYYRWYILLHIALPCLSGTYCMPFDFVWYSFDEVL